jgi:outer membrane lipopolysaccharide assembly protein LptE/RlpB
MKKGVVALLLFLCVLTSCGYHLAGKRLNAGRGQTIAVPTFINRTTLGYRLEQRFSEALRQELVRRTHFAVGSGATGDVVVSGEVLSMTLSPVILSPQGRGSTYSLIVDMKVNVLDTRTNSPIFQNEHWTFRDVFDLSQNSSDFVPEDSAAMDRLSRRFATTLVDTILHAKP